jgi:hypothetical protein
MSDLPTRLFEDASIMRTKGGFPTIAAELDEAAEEILSLKGLLGNCLTALRSIADSDNSEPSAPDDEDWRWRFLEAQRVAKATLENLS